MQALARAKSRRADLGGPTRLASGTCGPPALASAGLPPSRRYVAPQLRGRSPDAADRDREREQRENDSNEDDVFDEPCLRPPDRHDKPDDQEEEHDENRQTNEPKHARRIRRRRTPCPVIASKWRSATTTPQLDVVGEGGKHKDGIALGFRGRNQLSGPHRGRRCVAPKSVSHA